MLLFNQGQPLYRIRRTINNKTTCNKIYSSTNFKIMITKHQMVYMTLTLIYLILSGCSKKQAAEMTPVKPEKPESTVTYTNFTQALFQTKCAGCHAAGRGAASIWTFNGLSSITTNQARIRQAVLINKSMPKNGSLSAAELQSLQEWFDKNMPE